ncbi:BZ3500_MvSof-1268-A1-R1_Chr10-1g02555 [Microbotryum saponariae]|uniref:BZ3500_MvSof-1268-A1-R1_Chr10-1g02555 protein n=1 Tax=Microbotryum saponariae TaxID=289078 RepID=A0A2X0N8Q4_9BASI|nr:BZ3500_MvSof-1268-A1-R1_Chr10-1g02555 [Microbotryum saponariae]SDA06044.1 BZ3501_MvSof-1269-A2-R1_Chr10-1g02156 [Microbotryum saponariae]
MDMLDTGAGTGASMIDNKTQSTSSPAAPTSSQTPSSTRTTTTTTSHTLPAPWILPQPFGPIIDLQPFTLPEPPRRKTTPPPSPDHRLESRFSSETLGVAASSSPNSLISAGFRFQRLFTRDSMQLSPTSEGSSRSYTRGHAASRSCDRIESAHGHGHGRQRSRSRSRSGDSACKEEILEISSRSTDGRWGVGGIAKEVVETLKKRRQGSKSNESGRASPVDHREQVPRSESPALSMQNGSLDLPRVKPPGSESSPHRTPQSSPNRRPPEATGHRYSKSTSDIVLPPPRSDSRLQDPHPAAQAAVNNPSSSQLTPRRPPPMASCRKPTSPPTRPLPARPISPPSIPLGVRPLFVPKRLPPPQPLPGTPSTFDVFTPLPSTPLAPMNVGETSSEQATFSALILERPEPFDIVDKTPETLLIKLNIGAEVHLTTLSTLTTRNRAGKLADFVQGAVNDIRRRLPDTGPAQPKPSCIRSSSAYASSSDDGESIILNASHFATSRSPSPFPYEEHCGTTAQSHETIDICVESLKNGPNEGLDDDCEVMDPHFLSYGELAKKLAEKKAKLFLPLPSFTTPPLAVQHHAKLCKTPSPKNRIHSIHPQIVRPESTLEFGTDSDDEIESQSTSITLPSLGTRDTNLFERRLKSHLITETLLPPLPTPSEASSSEKAHAMAMARREVKSVPVDVLADENDDDEAVPRLPQRMEFVVPRFNIIDQAAEPVEATDVKQTVPSTVEDTTAMGGSLVSSPHSFLETSKLPSPPLISSKQQQAPIQVLTIFLDRPPPPYVAIMSYLRSAASSPSGKGVLPPSLTFPTSSTQPQPRPQPKPKPQPQPQPQPKPKPQPQPQPQPRPQPQPQPNPRPQPQPYSTSTSSPNHLDRTHLDLLHLSPSILMHRISSLRELAREAHYLGMSELLELIENERSTIVQAVRVLKAEREVEKRKERERRGGAGSTTSSSSPKGTPPVARKVESVLRERKAAGWI